MDLRSIVKSARLSCEQERFRGSKGFSCRLPRRACHVSCKLEDASGKKSHNQQPTDGSQQHQQPRSVARGTAGVLAPVVDEPLSPMDVDPELWAVLDLCSDDELESLYNILHSTSPFSPVLKSLVVQDKEPALISQRGRRSVMHKIESKFRFLAADSATLLRGARPSYRCALLNIVDKLDVRCSRNLATYDLETEVFLHVLHNCVEYVHGPEHRHTDTGQAVAFADGTALGPGGQSGAGGPNGVGPGAGGAAAGALNDSSSATAYASVFPTTTHSNNSRTSSSSQAASSSSSGTSPASPSASASPDPQSNGHANRSNHERKGGRVPYGNWTERVTAPLRLGLKDLAPTLVNLAGVVTVTKVGQQAAQQLASSLLCSQWRYQAALRAAAAAGGLGGAAKGAAAAWGKTAVLEAAQRSLTAATARYAALRGALSLLGPLMWGWLAVDLALKAIGTDYARVVRAVFLMSQVRLVRTHGFVSPDGAVVVEPGAGGPAAAAGGGMSERQAAAAATVLASLASMDGEEGRGGRGGGPAGGGLGRGGGKGGDDDDFEDYTDPGAAFPSR